MITAKLMLVVSHLLVASAAGDDSAKDDSAGCRILSSITSSYCPVQAGSDEMHILEGKELYVGPITKVSALALKYQCSNSKDASTLDALIKIDRKTGEGTDQWDECVFSAWLVRTKEQRGNNSYFLEERQHNVEFQVVSACALKWTTSFRTFGGQYRFTPVDAASNCQQSFTVEGPEVRNEEHQGIYKYKSVYCEGLEALAECGGAGGVSLDAADEGSKTLVIGMPRCSQVQEVTLEVGISWPIVRYNEPSSPNCTYSHVTMVGFSFKGKSYSDSYIGSGTVDRRCDSIFEGGLAAGDLRQHFFLGRSGCESFRLFG